MAYTANERKHLSTCQLDLLSDIQCNLRRFCMPANELVFPMVIVIGLLNTGVANVFLHGSRKCFIFQGCLQNGLFFQLRNFPNTQLPLVVVCRQKASWCSRREHCLVGYASDGCSQHDLLLVIRFLSVSCLCNEV